MYHGCNKSSTFGNVTNELTNRIFVVTISDAIFYSVIFCQCINSLCENDFSFQFRVEINANKVFKKL